MAQVSGNPDALEQYSSAMEGAFGDLDGVIRAYGAAVISYNSAPSDLGSCMISRAGAVSATGNALRDLDREPAAFAYALRQLDHHILPGGAYSISATSMFDALVSARLANPTLDDGALRRVAIVDLLKAALSKISGLPPGLLEKFFAAFVPLPTDLSWTDAQVASTLEGLLGLDPGRPPGAIVQPLVPPDAVRAFVALLTSAQLEALAANHPELVGPVDGMPHELRYQANRTLIDRTLDQARLDGNAALVKTLEGLAGADRKFLFFDPAGDGRAAEVFGDLTTADDVTVFVPGITNTLANFKATSENAHRIYDEMDLRDPSGSHGAIAWLGYDTPGLVDAPLPGRAHESAPLLRQLWDGLALPDAVNTTVVAHSYGSLVAATALRDGFRGVDNFVVIGSPGLEAGSLRDLHLADGVRFFAGRAPFDPVSLTESFGRDPSDPRFGGARFDTGPGVTGHSGYTSKASTSVRNLANISLGDYGNVTTIEPTIAERGVGILDDAEHQLLEVPVDEMQRLDEDLRAVANRGIDFAQNHLPLGPLQGPIDSAQRDLQIADQYTDSLIDVVQRLSSPDLWGDVIGDFFAVGTPQRLFDAGVDKAGDLAGDAVDLAGGAVDKVGDAARSTYRNTLGRIPGL